MSCLMQLLVLAWWIPSEVVSVTLFLGISLVLYILFARRGSQDVVEIEVVQEEDPWDPTPEVERLIELASVFPAQFVSTVLHDRTVSKYYSPLPDEVVFGVVAAKYLMYDMYSMLRVTRSGHLVVTSKGLYFNANDFADNVMAPLSDFMTVNTWKDGVSIECRSGRKLCFTFYPGDPREHPLVVKEMFKMVASGFDLRKPKVTSWSVDKEVN